MFKFKRSFYLFLVLNFLIIFICFSFFVKTGLFFQLDHYLDNTMSISPNSFLFFVSWILAYLYLPLIVLLVSLFCFFLYHRQHFETKLLVFSFLGWAISEFILKPFFQISCPSSQLGQFYSFQEVLNLPFLHSYAQKYPCYPSGHTVGYVVFFGYLAILAFRYIKNRYKRHLIYSFVTFVIVLVGPSRIYLHVHWLSDVVAGYILGLSILIGLILLRYKQDHQLILRKSVI